MPNTAQGYCEEFCLSIDPSRFSSGNWFGRLLSFKYKLYNFFGNDYTEEEFRSKLKDGSIKIIEISEPSNVTDNFGTTVGTDGTITGEFTITAEIDGKTKTATYSFEHEVKWSIHATKTTLTEMLP